MSNTNEIEIIDLTAMQKLGEAFGKLAKASDIICLDGDLGAGKTTFTQALARGLHVSKDQYVSSPSFAILHEYLGRIPLYHMDFYRLNSYDEIYDLGFDEFIFGTGISVIEWFKRMGEDLPEERIEIHISITGENSRNIRLVPFGSEWHHRIPQILKEFNDEPFASSSMVD